MNWLEKHLRDFVFPNLLTHPTKIGPSIRDFGMTEPKVPFMPFTGTLRPAADCEFPETGQLKALLRSSGGWIDLTWSTRQQFQKMDLQSILAGHERLQRFFYHRRFTNEQIIHTIVKNSIKDLIRECNKSKNRAFLLGRDVWVWAVLANKMGLPHVYDPRISRNVAVRLDKMKEILLERGVQNGDVIFDTGFAGSIFRACENAVPITLKNMMLSSHDQSAMQFRNHGPARNRALFIEYLPKYFETGHVEGNVVVQKLSRFDEFVRAALVTIWAWNFESPSWISGPGIIKKGKKEP